MRIGGEQRVTNKEIEEKIEKAWPCSPHGLEQP